MKKFDIEFDVYQKFTYTGTINADTPEEAIKRYKEYPDQWQTDEDGMQESYDDLDTVICIGERVECEHNSNSTHLERFKEPIKLKE